MILASTLRLSHVTYTCGSLAVAAAILVVVGSGEVMPPDPAAGGEDSAEGQSPTYVCIVKNL